MNPNTRQSIIQHSDAIINLVGSLAISLLFISGLGRYRFVLVYAVYCLINSSLSYGKPGRKVTHVFLPATLAAIYLDIENGPFLPILTKNSLLIAWPLMLILDYFVRYYSKKAIEVVAEGQIFTICPKCKYGNKELVATCPHCSYETGVVLAPTEILQLNSKSLPIKVLRMIGLKDDEAILFSIKLFPFKSVCKNGERQIRTYFIITRENVIFLDYFYFSESWREKDVIPIKEIVSIKCKMKKIYLSEEPTLEIILSNQECYEIIFKKFGKDKEYIPVITETIETLIAQENPISDSLTSLKYIEDAPNMLHFGH